MIRVAAGLAALGLSLHLPQTAVAPRMTLGEALLFYWPGGSDSDDLRAAFNPVQGLTKELSTFLVEGSYLADTKFAAAVYESREWADFVLVSADARQPRQPEMTLP